MNLINAIKKFKEENKRLLFTTPGHGQGSVVPANVKSLLGGEVFKSDLSEIDDFDNIRNPQGLFLESQKQTSEIYDSKQSFYLFNGSSSGILAIMTATVRAGEKVLIARNAHVSVYNALVLTGAVPVWLGIDIVPQWNIAGAISPQNIEKALDAAPDIKTLFLTNPTYEGVVCDISTISKICKKKNILLIVDEAHGALWSFNDRLPRPAIKQGADASVQSLHKTATALNQGAILHIAKDSRINPDKIQKCLNLINSTSPSYPILASVEGAIEYLNNNEGQKQLAALLFNIDTFRNKISNNDNLQVLSSDKSLKIDSTKLFISINGLSGYELSSTLIEKFNIEDELCNEKGILAITGIGTSGEKLNKLSQALIEIAKDKKLVPKDDVKKFTLPIPEMVYTPREAFYMDSYEENISKCEGLVLNELIIPYPPGIPILIPGERIKREHIKFFTERKTLSVIKE